MARYSKSLLLMGISFWACCSTSAVHAAGNTVQEQLEQLNNNYIEMKTAFAEKLESLEQRNLRNQEILMAQVTQLEAKVTRMEELEIKVQQQDSLIFSLQQRDIDRSSNGVTVQLDSNFVSNNASLRAAPLSAMPHSCGDLKNLGYTLKGVYLVVGVKLVETIYCDFSKPTTDPNFQTLIGYADVKSKPTYFYVQRDYLQSPSLNQFTQTQIPIPYDKEITNVGGAMNLQTGKFTAPRTGKYFFSFTGMAFIQQISFPETPSQKSITIGMFMNGNGINQCASDEITSLAGNQLETLTLQSTLNLQAGDQIWMFVYGMHQGVSLLGYGFTHFTGFLLEEEINSLVG